MKIQLLWEFGISDEMTIFFLKKEEGFLNIVNKINNHGKPLIYYIELLKEVARNEGYVYGKCHIPVEGYFRTFSGGVLAGTLRDHGFKINKWKLSNGS